MVGVYENEKNIYKLVLNNRNKDDDKDTEIYFMKAINSLEIKN